MPIVLEGIPFLALALSFALLLLALAIQHGILRPIAAVVRGVPGVGGHLASRIEGIGNVMVRWMLAAIGYQMRLVTALWHGTEAAFSQLVGAPHELATAVEGALHLLRHGVIPSLIKAAVSPVARLAHQGLDLAEASWRYGHAQVVRLDGKIDHWATHFARVVEQPWLYFQRNIWPDAKHELDVAYRAATRELPAELGRVEREAAAAVAASERIGADVESAVSRAVGTVPGEVLAAERAVAAELPELAGLDLPDVERLLRELPWGTLAGLLAAVPLLRVLAQTIASESGLDRAECRSKVRGICSTDPAAWARLLLGLTAVGIGFSLEDLIKAGITGVQEAEGLIEQLSGS